MALVDIYLDPVTGDLAFVNGTIRKTQSLAEVVRQKVEIALRGFRGEWAFNIDAFPPYLENDNNPIQILGEATKPVFDSYIVEEILNVEGVNRLSSFNSVFNPFTGVISINFVAVLEDDSFLTAGTELTI